MSNNPSILLWIFPAVLSASSNGHRCLVRMIRELIGIGVPCGILVPSPTRFQNLSTLHIPKGVSIIRSDQIPASSFSVVATDTSDVDYVNELVLETIASSGGLWHHLPYLMLLFHRSNL